MDDVLNDALSNLEHDNYELSYQGYKDRQADIALIRATLAAQSAPSAEHGPWVESTLKEYEGQKYCKRCCVMFEYRDRKPCVATPVAAQALAAQPATQGPTMNDAIAAGDGTLHGAIDHWQTRALEAERKLSTSAEPSDEELAQIWRQVSGRETLRPDSVAMKFARALLSRYGKPSGDAQSVATLRYERSKPGCENEMPRVISCNWLPDGDYIVYAAPVAAQKADDNDVVYLGGSAPPIPRWVVDSADRIAKYMDANWPGEWALGRIQSRATQKADAAREWQPIETAPVGLNPAGAFWCLLAYGPADDQSISHGFRWHGKWYAAGTFYRLGQERLYELREVEVHPTHWMPMPELPADLPPTIAQ